MRGKQRATVCGASWPPLPLSKLTTHLAELGWGVAAGAAAALRPMRQCSPQRPAEQHMEHKTKQKKTKCGI